MLENWKNVHCNLPRVQSDVFRLLLLSIQQSKTQRLCKMYLTYSADGLDDLVWCLGLFAICEIRWLFMLLLTVKSQKYNLVCKDCLPLRLCDGALVSCRQLHHHHRRRLQDPNSGHRRRASEAADLGHSGPGEIQNHHINVKTSRWKQLSWSLWWCHGGVFSSLCFICLPPGTTGTHTVSLLFMTWQIQSRL